jgi:RNA polymerase sigma factor (sigma-70 family)
MAPKPIFATIACRPSLYAVSMDASEEIKLDLPQAGFGQRVDADAALEGVFRAQYPRLIGLLARVTCDRAKAEELASEAFCKLAKRPVLFRPGNNLEGWLYRTAMNLGLDSLKIDLRRRRHEQAAAIEAAHASTKHPSPLDDLLRAEQQQRVRTVLSGLREQSARVLLLRNTGFSYRELARVLDLNPASVGKLLVRSMAEFEQRYREMYGGKP